MIEKTYEIYFPGGHLDFLGKDTPIASTNSYEDMLHRVEYYWYYPQFFSTRLHLTTVHGPLYVKTKEMNYPDCSTDHEGPPF